MQLKFGTDPEFFLRSKETGEFVSAHGLIPGTKEKPFIVPGGAIQVDGMAVEFNTAPTTYFDVFSDNINIVLEDLKGRLPEYDFVFNPSVEFSEEVMKAQSPEAKELGCEPDFNAWKDGKENESPDASTNMRTGSGHIHIGWTKGADVTDEGHLAGCMALVKTLDVTLLILSKLWDGDSSRRKLYGNPGAFRPKPYGVEYRSLSNAWLNYPQLYSNLPRFISLVWDNLIKTNGKAFEKSSLKTYEDVLDFMDRETTTKEISLLIYRLSSTMYDSALVKNSIKIDKLRTPQKPKFNVPTYSLKPGSVHYRKSAVDLNRYVMEGF